MQVSIDISMYPLEREYREPILAFIDRLAAIPGVSVVRNDLATQVFGDYDRVMGELTDSVKAVLAEHEETVFVIKLVGGNRHGQNA